MTQYCGDLRASSSPILSSCLDDDDDDEGISTGYKLSTADIDGSIRPDAAVEQGEGICVSATGVSLKRKPIMSEMLGSLSATLGLAGRLERLALDLVTVAAAVAFSVSCGNAVRSFMILLFLSSLRHG